jgi:hypothetical protein
MLYMYILLLIKNLSINRNLYSLGLTKNEVLYITQGKVLILFS